MLFSRRKHCIYQFKNRKHFFFHVIKISTLCLYIQLVEGVASLMEAKHRPILLSRVQTRAQHPTHCPVPMSKLYPFHPYCMRCWLLQCPWHDFAAWIQQGVMALRHCGLVAGITLHNHFTLQAEEAWLCCREEGGIRIYLLKLWNSLNVHDIAWACVHMLWA